MVKRSLSELFSRLYDDHLFSGWRRERRWGSSKQANNEIEQEYEEIDDDYYPGDEDLDQEDDDDDDDDEQVFFGIQQTYGQEDDNADEVVELEDDEDEYVNEGMMLIEPISPSQSLFGDEDDDDDDDNDQAGDKNIGYTPKNDNDAYFGRSRRQALHSPQPKIITTEPQMDWVVDEWDEDLDGIEAMDELMDWFEGADHIKPDSASAPRPPIVASSGSQSISSISKSSTIIRRGGRRSSNGMRDQGAATDDTPGAIFVYTSPFRRLFTRPWHF
ncbi:hypothetical protein BG011_009792 [Mortierella polycephala]|uniref:Uncharacterized protein n=1 Tax=Mortierella polycephala TaxID=41804 RepID=A0A9P6QBM7_9FUNG|nr:hypothetical protein BG011_009792 [Mortierella polycephala]